ncbi:hypothetical protein FQA39_LY00367 [Lamprigera yunnana]|nr:hypothetical protein FQA39_LY00367 [Lamprigera yunnana]
MIKFAIKTGIVCGSIYYASQEGLWRGGDESTKLCGKIYNAFNPYYLQLKQQVPVDIPDLPQSLEVRYVLKQTWNKGVTGFFVFLSNVPNYISGYTKCGVKLLMSNENVKKMYQSVVPSVGNNEENKSR